MAHQRVRIHIKGISPGLLMNRPGEAIGASRKQRTKLAPPKEEIAATAAYRLDDNDFNSNLCIPSHCLWTSFWEGSKEYRLGRIVAFALQIERDVDLGTSEYEIFSTPVRAGARASGRIMGHRPRLREWEGDVYISFNTEFLDLAAVLKIIAVAGAQKGVLCWRPSAPEKPGPWGRYEIVEHELLDA